MTGPADRTSPNGQTPPHAEVSEQSLIGHTFHLTRIPAGVVLPPNAFYRPRHETIWAAVCSLADQQKPCDMPSVLAYLSDHGKIEPDGIGSEPLSDVYLLSLLEAPRIGDPVHTAGIIREKAQRRQTLELFQRGLQQAQDGELDLAKLLQRTEEELAQISGTSKDDDARLLFPRLDWHELWADDTDEEWIVYPLIGARRGTAIYSPAKIGKSLLMLEVAVGVSRGTKVLGYTPTRRYRVLYVDFENDPRGDVRTRLQDMGYSPDDLDHLDYLSYPTLTDLDTAQGAARMMAAVKAYGSELAIIDTISRAVIGEENSNDTWNDFYRHTGLSLKRAGVAMARLDHTGKDEDKGQRGGSAKGGDVDAVWRLTKITEDRFRLECTFKRFRLDTVQLNLIRREDPLRHVVEDLTAVTEREAKILHIISLADKAGLRADASWRDLQAHGRAHNVKARNDLYNEAARRRKVVPNLRDHDSGQGGPQPAGTSGDRPLDFDPESVVPNPGGSSGITGSGGMVPGPTTIGGDQGTAGSSDPGPAPADLIPGTQNCRHCGDPIEGPPLTKGCPGPHRKEHDQ